MKNLIALILEFLIYTYVFGHIFLFWINRIRPALQKHYSMAKSDVALLQKHFYTTKSKVALLQKHFFTTKSLFAALPGYIFTSMWNSTFLQRNFPVSMRYIFKGKLDRSRQ
ncbi:MAG: hypothetical protein PF450_12845 [Bacteroidales bacterium]|jgi:hypothetical protein|nr:hypothetical protein [Bacteroidales bacterium]